MPYLQKIYTFGSHTLHALLNRSKNNSAGGIYSLENTPFGGSHDLTSVWKCFLVLTLEKIKFYSKPELEKRESYKYDFG